MPPLPINAKMYAVADKYDMQGLKKKAELKFKNGLTKIVEIHAVTRDISQLFTAIPIVYTTTPDSDRALRDAIAIFAAENWTRLLTVPEFKTCMEENIDFVIDVVAKTMLCRENCNHCIVSDAGGRIRG